MEVKINLNSQIKVKLTDYGKDIFYHQFDEINAHWGEEKIKPHYPFEDEEGYSYFQLWCFINLYGGHMSMGEKNVIKPLEIIYETKEE